ncbi:hypothetical protein [Nocardia brevicatena]|uniref:hypothetical protein n=1 Tax=Nocardia brevicatena TaxID=37327 RepID=UPI0002DB4762|nr:hypothetical protein [Nocardia brevicatena]
MTAQGKAAAAWAGLNPRQRLYLSTILDFDQAAEADIKRRSANWETVPPAAEWRQILYDIKLPKEVVGYSSVQSRLREAGQHDPGSGSTLAALERRDLVIVTHDLVYVPQLQAMVPRIRVRLSTLGRAAARHGVGVAAPVTPPRGLLSQVLFNALALLYAAGHDGLVLNVKGAPSWDTLVRLRNRPYDPWIEEFTGPTEHAARASRVRTTANARRHYQIHHACYRELYPDIDAPEPVEVAHVTHAGLADHRVRTPKHLLAEADVRILSELVRLTGEGSCWLQRLLLRDYRDEAESVPESVRGMRPGLLRNQVKDLARADKPIQRLTGWSSGALAEVIELTDEAITRRWPPAVSLLVLTDHGGEHYARRREEYRQLYSELHLPPSLVTAGHDG